MSRVSSKNQVTIPVGVLREVGVEPGDEVVIRAAGHGRIEIERSSDRTRRVIEDFAGRMPPGAYPPGYLDELRDEWER